MYKGEGKILKILIVDDEPLVCVFIRSMIQWETYGLEIAYEASNGREAMDMIKCHREDIDLVITDMDMPLLNGLELIEQIKDLEMAVPPAIIVLSAYEDFHMVRSAFKRGVTDYILKSEMEAQGFLELIQTVLKRRQKTLSNQNKEISQEQPKDFKEHYLKSLLFEEVKEINKKQFSEIGISIQPESIILGILHIDQYDMIQQRYKEQDISQLKEAILNIIKGLLKRCQMGEVVSLAPDEYILFLSPSYKPSTETMEMTYILDEVIEDIRHNLLQYMNMTATIVLTAEDSIKVIKERFEEGMQHSKLGQLFGYGTIIKHDQAILIYNHQLDELRKESKDFLDYMVEGTEERAIVALGQLLHYSTLQLLYLIIERLNGMGEKIEQIFGKDVHFYQRFRQLEAEKDHKIWLVNLLRWIMEYLRDKKTIHKNMTIAKALKFIQANYQDENITIKMVSDYIELSENYFSLLFKKEMGETFKNYLTRLRVKKAKELMERTNYKLYQICEDIGYHNVEHFSRTFKKMVGCSPNYFRNHYLASSSSEEKGD